MVHRFDHRQHHPTDRAIGQRGYIVRPPGGAEAIDANPVGVVGAKPTHHVVTRGVLVFGRDGILDVEHDDVGARVRRRFEPVGMRAVDQ